MKEAGERLRLCYLANAASIHTRRWATHFASLGHEVHVISFQQAALPGVEVHWLRPRTTLKPIDYPLAVPAARRLLEHIVPDVVHAHYVTSYGLVAVLAGIRPLVVTAWGSDVLLAPRRSPVHRMLVSSVLRRADLVTSMAHHMTETMTGMGIDGSKVITVPFGVDTAVFHPGLRAPTADLEVICTRNFEPVYNVRLLLDALPHVAAQLPRVRCALLGDGSLRGDLAALARANRVEERVAWVGRVDQPGVARWLARARVFVTPALSDGNNISLNEAMACGCFPVASDIPANREWLADGENGFLVPVDRPDLLADRIIRALRDGELQRRAAARNWEIVRERADWRKNMADVEQWYWRLRGRRTTG
ncbi:MAG TPA: glycosyltransferase [bacterium]|nr:glycosyltransferase [bacterium]